MTDGPRAVLDRAIEAWNRRDEEALVLTFTPDAVVRSALVGSAGRDEFRGYEGVREWFRELVDTMGVRFEIRDALVHRGSAVAIGTMKTQGASSGVDVATEVGLLFTFRDGAIAEAQGYVDPAGAIEALGRLTRRDAG